MDADSFIHNNEPGLVILDITRDKIEKMETASLMERLLIFVDRVENVRLYKHSMTFQISGYDHDPRELCEIPEVRRFFAAVTQEWPFFVWFLARKMGSVALYFSLMCDVEVVRQKKKMVGMRFKDLEQMGNFLMEITGRADQTFCALGIPDEELAASIESAVDELVGR